MNLICRDHKDPPPDIIRLKGTSAVIAENVVYYLTTFSENKDCCLNMKSR